MRTRVIKVGLLLRLVFIDLPDYGVKLMCGIRWPTRPVFLLHIFLIRRVYPATASTTVHPTHSIHRPHDPPRSPTGLFLSSNTTALCTSTVSTHMFDLHVQIEGRITQVGLATFLALELSIFGLSIA